METDEIRRRAAKQMSYVGAWSRCWSSSRYLFSLKWNSLTCSDWCAPKMKLLWQLRGWCNNKLILLRCKALQEAVLKACISSSNTLSEELRLAKCKMFGDQMFLQVAQLNMAQEAIFGLTMERSHPLVRSLQHAWWSSLEAQSVYLNMQVAQHCRNGSCTLPLAVSPCFTESSQ